MCDPCVSVPWSSDYIKRDVAWTHTGECLDRAVTCPVQKSQAARAGRDNPAAAAPGTESCSRTPPWTVRLTPPMPPYPILDRADSNRGSLIPKRERTAPQGAQWPYYYFVHFGEDFFVEEIFIKSVAAGGSCRLADLMEILARTDDFSWRHFRNWLFLMPYRWTW